MTAGPDSLADAVDLDRLLRSTRDLNTLIDRGLMAVTIDGEIDVSTADGKFRATMPAGIARFEVRRKAERQSRGHVQRAQQGDTCPKGTRPLWYATNGDLIEHEAAAMRELYRLFAVQDGPSITSLAATLSGRTGEKIPKSIPHRPKHTRTLMIERNERWRTEGLREKPVPDDGPWSSSTVLGILRNPRHAGYSVYTDRNERAKANKRRQRYAQIIRDDNGDPIKGQWTQLVSELTWLTVQEPLNDQRRMTNKTDSTKRKHLGSSLYLCGICDRPITSHSRGYRCAGEGNGAPAHVTRSREYIDEYVVCITRTRLALPDLQDVIPSRDEPRLREIQAEITKHQGKIKRARHDYDDEIIEGHDLKRVRDREIAAIAGLEGERRSLALGSDLDSILDSRDPVKAFNDADLAIKRRVIDFFVEVRIYPHPQGKKGFNPDTVKITPKLGAA
ncbi:recombinase family protein [Streptomyces sp. 24-1644]|uniref:recombinase family protein n=1 Tax=Streptomyces sp. 24-1644 TaxID=3457315 RepID=UPI003FA7478B